MLKTKKKFYWRYYHSQQSAHVVVQVILVKMEKVVMTLVKTTMNASVKSLPGSIVRYHHLVLAVKLPVFKLKLIDPG